ncbi:bacillithiol biosynthesis deacetylase BshB1 [Chlorobium sp. BLA1]|uniref:bacillithiol biosynthesis deacetylase BshB1 n=1 Tax=Candidatus Chlorobium masyuteum TaxID=2716876 RepID=UPI00141F6F5C|nr:bacillithiol biosynthesis deacetylase BshB1 [Candidatus Chlorobium masyuteum]NHQ60703.1 bacillithiol biosynthesis deacetylase BshB1 [Candidatus Chlorobium masyuteum]
MRREPDRAAQKVYALAFGAHPDDVELSCGATLLKIIGEGRQVAVCDLTRGEMGTTGTPETRRAEADRAAAVMGYQCRTTLDLGDSKLFYTEENLAGIIRVIRAFRPEVVFCNPPDERHPDHSKSSKLVTDACYYAGLKQLETSLNGSLQEAHRPHHLLYYIQFKHLEPQLIVDVSETFTASRKGVLAFASQFHREGTTGEPETLIKRPEFLTGLEARARYFGEQIGVTYGEGFRLSSTMAINSFSNAFPPKTTF